MSAFEKMARILGSELKVILKKMKGKSGQKALRKSFRT